MSSERVGNNIPARWRNKDWYLSLKISGMHAPNGILRMAGIIPALQTPVERKTVGLTINLAPNKEHIGILNHTKPFTTTLSIETNEPKPTEVIFQKEALIVED